MWLLGRIPEWWFHAVVFAGVVMIVLSQLPIISMSKTFRNVGVLVLAFGVYMEGVMTTNDYWKIRELEYKATIAQYEASAGDVSHTVEIRYVDRVRTIIEKGKDNERVVTVYVPQHVDSACTINNGFVVLHNGAAAGEKVPETPGPTNDEASGIRLSEVEEIVVKNYNKYHQVAAQLEELQNWVIEQRELFNK